MEFGLSLPSFGHLADADGIRLVAKGCEELGYSSIWAAERLLVPDPPNQPWSKVDETAFEPLTTLAFIAGQTRRIRLCTSVIILPVRNPVLLARVASSLDVLSGGRLELGIGVGWMREEMEVSGIPFGRRGKISDEYIQLIRNIWEGKEYDGKFVRVPSHLFKPRPVNGSIPIWIGGNSEIALRRAGRLGNGWIPMGGYTPEELTARISTIAEAASSAGRKDAIQICCNREFSREELSDPASCLRVVESYEGAGATHMIPRFKCDNLEEMIEMMQVFADGVISAC